MFANNDDEGSAFHTLNDALVHWAQHQPDALAISFLRGDEACSLTYKELHDAALRVAYHLTTVARPGDRAVLVYEQGLDYVVAFLGCGFAGVVAVTGCSPGEGRRSHRLQSVINDCGADIMLTTTAGSALMAPLLVDVGDTLYVMNTDMLEDAALPAPVYTQGSDLMFLQYTSGSTSTPKGVMLTHQAIAANLQLIRQMSAQNRHSVHVSWLPLFHDMGLIYMTLCPLYGGTPLYLMAPDEFVRDPIRWLKAISRYKGTHSAAPDFAYRLCMERITAEDRQQLDLSSMVSMVNGAEPILLNQAEAFLACFAACGLHKEAVWAGYGMAEVCVAATLGPMLDEVQAFDARLLETEGFACPCDRDAPYARLIAACGPVRRDLFDIRIVDPDNGLQLDPGRVGEIWLSGPSVGDGYWQKSDETATTFHAHLDGVKGTFMRSGDLGFVLNGRLHVCGRLKEMMIVRGRNIFPADVCTIIEHCTEHMHARRAAAFSVVGAQGEEIVVACAARVDEHDHQAVARKMAAEVNAQLGVMPAAILFLDNKALQRTTSGKVQHMAMRQAYLRGALPLRHVVTFNGHVLMRPAEAPAPLALAPTLAEPTLPRWLIAQVCEACATVCQCDRVDLHDNLFEMGLDSLKAMRLLTSLEGILMHGATRMPCLSDIAELKTPYKLMAFMLHQEASATPHEAHDYVEVSV